MHVLLCIAIHLYHGPVQDGTPVTELHEECKAVSWEKARRALNRCGALPATSCEWFKYADRYVIENKIQVSE